MDFDVLSKSMSDLCRTCMSSDTKLSSVFSIVNISGKVSNVIKQESIASMLSECISLQVEPSDGLPQRICHTCLKKLVSCHLFQFACHETQLKLQAIKKQQTEEDNSDNDELIIIKSECFDYVEADDIAMQGDSLFNSDKDEQVSEKDEQVREKQEELREEVKNTIPLSNRDDSNDETAQPVYKCKICSKVCSNRYVLNRHMKVHGNFKELQCHICLKRFSSSNGKERHLRVHTGEKPYNCEHCDRNFSQSGLLYTHLRRVHNVTPKKKTIEDRDDSWKWSFLCTVCGHRYASSTGLAHHIKIKHPEEHEKELASRSIQKKHS